MTISKFTIAGREWTSYASVDESDQLLSIDIEKQAAWNALDTAAKQVRLVNGTRLVDRAGTYTGQRVSESQETEFPRENITCNGEPVGSTLPDDIVLAAVLLAGRIAATPSVVQPAQAVRGPVQSVRAGPAEVRFYNPGATAAAQPSLSVPDDEAHAIVRCYFVGTVGLAGGGESLGAVSGGGQSRFTDECLDRYGTRRPYWQ